MQDIWKCCDDLCIIDEVVLFKNWIVIPSEKKCSYHFIQLIKVLPVWTKRLSLKFIGLGLKVTSKTFEMAAATLIVLLLLKPSYLSLNPPFYLLRSKHWHVTISCLKVATISLSQTVLMLKINFLNSTGNIRIGIGCIILCIEENILDFWCSS